MSDQRKERKEWKEAYDRYIKSPEWISLKVYLLQMRGCKCEKCGKPKHPAKLQIHHLTYERLFNEDAKDLMVLCAICHMKEHGLIKEKKKRKQITKKRKINYALNVIKRFRRGGYYSYNAYKRALKAARKRDKR